MASSTGRISQRGRSCPVWATALVRIEAQSRMERRRARQCPRKKLSAIHRPPSENSDPKTTMIRIQTYPRCPRQYLGNLFEKNVMTYIETIRTCNNVSENQVLRPWQYYLRQLLHGQNVLDIRQTCCRLGRSGNTADILIQIGVGTIKKYVNISCKRNNEYICHPRVRSFLRDDNLRLRYENVKNDFDADTMRYSNMTYYYQILCEITKMFLESDLITPFEFLYPTDIHLIHNKGPCRYFPQIGLPSGVSVHIIHGKGNSRGKSCNLVVEYDNNVTIQMRIHNAEGSKAHHKSDPWKWEVCVKLN